MRVPKVDFAWDEGMSVGIPDVDAEHKKFIVLINDLNRAITSRKSPAVIEKCLLEIIDDAVRHFANEEKLFIEWNYPNARQHAEIHTSVLKSLEEIKKKFIPYGHDSDWVDAGVKIKKILVDHILKEDMKYATHFHQINSAANSKE